MLKVVVARYHFAAMCIISSLNCCSKAAKMASCESVAAVDGGMIIFVVKLTNVKCFLIKGYEK